MLDVEEPNPQAIPILEKIVPLVEYEGHKIYMSILVAPLNGIPFLSKDCLTQVRNDMHFNINDAYFDAYLHSSRIAGLGLDVGVYFVQRNSTTILSTIKAAMTRKKTSKENWEQMGGIETSNRLGRSCRGVYP